MTRYSLKVPPFQIFLGSADITDAVVGYSFRHPLAEPSTPLIWTGTIELFPVRSGLPRSFFDDELNPSRWLSGHQPIDVYFQGVWWQRFRIKPSGYRFNQDNGQAEIEITDIIGILDSYQPAADAPEFKTGQTNRWTDLAVALIRKQAELMGRSVSVETPPFIDGVYTIPRTVRGSYIKEAQKMAGERQLWMWSDRETIKWAAYTQTGAIAWRKSRRELLSYTRQQGLEPVVSEVTVSGTHEQFDQCQQNYPRRYYSYASGEIATSSPQLAQTRVLRALVSITTEDRFTGKFVTTASFPFFRPVTSLVRDNNLANPYIYVDTKQVIGDPSLTLFGGQVNQFGNVAVQIPEIKGYTATKLGGTDWWIQYQKQGENGRTSINWRDLIQVLREEIVTTYENVPFDSLNASKLVSKVVTRQEPLIKFPEIAALFSIGSWRSIRITEQVTTRYTYREIFRDDIIVAQGVKLYEIDTIEEFTLRIYARESLVTPTAKTYALDLVPAEYTKTTYVKECLTRWRETKETKVNRGQSKTSAGYLFTAKTEQRDVFSIPSIEYRPAPFPVTQKPLLAKVGTGYTGVSNFVQDRAFESSSTLTNNGELQRYAQWLGEVRRQRYYSRELATGYTSVLGYQPFQRVQAGNGEYIRDRFGISLNQEGDSWQFVEDCIGNKIGTIPEILTPPIPRPPLLISTLNIGAIANQSFVQGAPITPIPLSAAGGQSPYAFSSTALPMGLSIVGSQIVGTPSAIATTSITVTVTDALGDTDDMTFGVAIVAAPVPVGIITPVTPIEVVWQRNATISIFDGVPVRLAAKADWVRNATISFGNITARLVSENRMALPNNAYARLINRNYLEVSTSNPLNNKIIAYWTFNSIDTIEYDPLNSAEFVINAKAPSDLTYAWLSDNLPPASVQSGLIGNALSKYSRLRTDSIYSADPSVFSPQLNGFNFIGFSFWLKINNSNFSWMPYDSEASYNILNISGYSIIFNFSRRLTGDPDIDAVSFDIVLIPDIDSFFGALFLDLGEFEIDSTTGVPFSSDVNQWNLITFTLDNATGICSSRLNTNPEETRSYTIITDPIADSVIFGEDFISIDPDRDLDLLIDETFIFSEPLTDTEIAQIYNGGAGNTYPF